MINNYLILNHLLSGKPQNIGKITDTRIIFLSEKGVLPTDDCKSTLNFKSREKNKFNKYTCTYIKAYLVIYIYTYGKSTDFHSKKNVEFYAKNRFEKL